MNVVVLGAGGVGTTIARMLAGSRDYRVVLADRDAHALSRVSDAGETHHVDAKDPAAVRALLTGRDAVINALPFSFVQTVAQAARDANVHYFDLTEDVAATRTVKALGAE